MKPITQREVLKGVRKPLPPATKVIIPKATKARRKRVKVEVEAVAHGWTWSDL